MSMSLSFYFDQAKIYSSFDFSANNLYPFLTASYVARHGILHTKWCYFLTWYEAEAYICK